MKMKNKFNLGKKGSTDLMTAGGVVVFIAVLAVMLWYYTQPEPPSLFVTKVAHSIEEKGTQCAAVVTGDVYNNGGITATGVSVQCSVGSGTKRPGFATIGNVEPRKAVKFEASVSLRSCSEAISEDCKVTACDNCE